MTSHANAALVEQTSPHAGLRSVDIVLAGRKHGEILRRDRMERPWHAIFKSDPDGFDYLLIQGFGNTPEDAFRNAFGQTKRGLRKDLATLEAVRRAMLGDEEKELSMRRRRLRQPRAVRVAFAHCFEDELENEILCEIRGTVHPGQREIIRADPDDCQEGFPAWFEFDDVVGLTRDLTADEYRRIAEDEELAENAFDAVMEECE